MNLFTATPERSGRTLLIEERHTGVVLAHKVVVNGVHLSCSLLEIEIISLLHHLFRGLAQQQPADLDISLEAGVRISL
jgi:hypothetical protein